MARSGRAAAVVEGAVTAIAGGALAALCGTLLDLTVPFAVLGALNGAIGGWRGVYHWRSLSGPVAFVLDSTWGLPMTLGALVAHAVAATQRRRGGYVVELSRRRNRHVYVSGLRVRRGFLMTVGNVINGAGERVRTSDRRRRLVTDHEDVHVWQARWFGPLFPPLYLGWTAVGSAVGAVLWLLRGRSRKTPLGKFVETCSYYMNPFEWWAYSRDGFWPPTNKVEGVGWSMPVVQAFSATTRSAGRGRGGTSATPR